MLVAYAARGIAAYEVRLALNVLRGFIEFGASRLAFREQPLPSKPVIPVLGISPCKWVAKSRFFIISRRFRIQ